MGEPKDIVGWLLSPLFLVLETLGELVRPISLSLRLFGNILGEDILLFVFCGIGIGLVVGIPGLSWMPIGLPIHLALAPLILMFSTIQALVFTLLSAVYISLKVPHGDHHDEAHAH
jgi:F-type H+-transporting ATPase subunit a